MYNNGIKAFSTATDISKNRLVTMAANGNISHCSATATNNPVGVTQLAGGSGDHVPVKLMNHPGTIEVTASGAITRGDEVAADASGKVQAMPTAAGDYKKIGIALEAATADGDIIEVLPTDIGIVTVSA